MGKYIVDIAGMIVQVPDNYKPTNSRAKKFDSPEEARLHKERFLLDNDSEEATYA